MDSFVVRTDYEDFAVVIQLSTEKLSGNKSTNLLLYSEWRKKKTSVDVLGPRHLKSQHVCNQIYFVAKLSWMFRLQVERWR